MVARGLDVAEFPLQAGRAVEAGAAGKLHGEVDGCDGVTRRSFLKAGFLGLAGLGLPDLLRAQAAAESQGLAPSDDLSVILVWLDGGPPQHETYDPKPDAPAEFRGPLRSINTAVPGIQLAEYLPNHARVMDKMEAASLAELVRMADQLHIQPAAKADSKPRRSGDARTR